MWEVLLILMMWTAFAVALLLERYNMLYIFTPQFDSGGKARTSSIVLPAQYLAAITKSVRSDTNRRCGVCDANAA